MSVWCPPLTSFTSQPTAKQCRREVPIKGGSGGAAVWSPKSRILGIPNIPTPTLAMLGSCPRAGATSRRHGFPAPFNHTSPGKTPCAAAPAQRRNPCATPRLDLPSGGQADLGHENTSPAWSRSVYRNNHGPWKPLRHGDVSMWCPALTTCTSKPTSKPCRWREVPIKGGSGLVECAAPVRPLL